MSGTMQTPNFSTLVEALVALTKTIGLNGKTLAEGIAVLSQPPVYTVAALPASAATGAFAWASNGRKPAEGAGAGTGVPVFFNSATGQWFSYLSGAVVTA